MNVILRRLVRLVAMVLLSWALIGPGLGYASMTCTTMASRHDHPCGLMASNGHKPSPEKSAMPGCLTHFGCLLVVGLPMTSAPAVRPYAWSLVDYWSLTATVRGISFQPAIGPPIPVM